MLYIISLSTNSLPVQQHVKVLYKESPFIQVIKVNHIMLKKFFSLPDINLLDIKNFNREALIYKVLPHLLMEIIAKYFRIQVEGIEKIPKKGRFLMTPNHSGYSGFDALVLTHEIAKRTQRVPRVLTHHLWFLTKTTSVPAEKLGFIEATTDNGLKYLEREQLVVLFPEGEHGNFKPSSEAYRLQEFKRGFIRMALKTQSPIIPTLVIGAEETHINLRKLNFSKYLYGLVLPLPLNIIPLPIKWKIKIFDPLYLPYGPDAADNTELVHELANDIREQMQQALNKELKERKSVF